MPAAGLEFPQRDYVAGEFSRADVERSIEEVVAQYRTQA